MIAPLSKNERVGAVSMTNCYSSSPESAILEVLNSQMQNKRTKADKTYHLVVSFPSGETPSAEVLKVIEERLCAVLGFADHQRVSAVHHDTDHMHVHIAINKIHPVRYTIHEPFNAHFTLGAACSRLEEEYGLQKTVHVGAKSRSENQAEDLERQAKVESLIGWIKRECSVSLQAAASWAELHSILNEHGLLMRERANGLVIATADGVMVKASSVSRQFSKKTLEFRLGVFEGAAESTDQVRAKKRYAKAPIRQKLDTTALFARYTTDQDQSTELRARAWSQAKARKDDAIEAAKRAARLKRAMIKSMITPGLARKVLYASTSRNLLEEIDLARKDYLSERQRVFRQFMRRSWADWLRAEAANGDAQALAVLRDRSLRPSMSGNSLRGRGEHHDTSFRGDSQRTARLDSVTKAGTLIYTVGRHAIRDTGEQLQVSADADQAAMEAALQMAAERYGSLIAVRGTESFKEQMARAAVACKLDVRFDDRVIELRRQFWLNVYSSKEKRNAVDTKHGRSDQRCAGRARRHRSQREVRPAARARSRSVGTQSGSGKTRKAPPPQSRDGMRELSELGVVHFTKGSEVLLPGDVPDHLEHAGPEPDHELRRHLPAAGRIDQCAAPNRNSPGVPRPGTAPPPSSRDRLQSLSRLAKLDLSMTGSTAESSFSSTFRPALSPAEKYIFEREQTKRKAFDIPKHSQYSFANGGVFTFAGLRVVDGQALALLRREGGISVLPVDQPTAARLKRMRLGRALSVSAEGVIKSKGRER